MGDPGGNPAERGARCRAGRGLRLSGFLPLLFASHRRGARGTLQLAPRLLVARRRRRTGWRSGRPPFSRCFAYAVPGSTTARTLPRRPRSSPGACQRAVFVDLPPTGAGGRRDPRRRRRRRGAGRHGARARSSRPLHRLYPLNTHQKDESL